MSLKKLRIAFLKFKIKYLRHFIKPYDFTELLLMQGVDVGINTIFYGPHTQVIDIERPWLLHIGDYCKITRGVIILAHDYSRSVLRRVYGEVIGEAGETVIGDNVFIGVNSIILMGSKIGNNVIVGAGSVISGTIPDNVVVAGNPARVIRNLNEHYSIRKRETVGEAKIMAQAFYKKYHRLPEISEMGPFWQLFMERNLDTVRKEKVFTKLNGDCEEEMLSAFLNSTPQYSSFKEFLESCGLTKN